MRGEKVISDSLAAWLLQQRAVSSQTIFPIRHVDIPDQVLGQSKRQTAELAMGSQALLAKDTA